VRPRRAALDAVLAVAFTLVAAGVLRGQDPPAAAPPPVTPVAQSEASPEDEEDLSFQPAQPDFTLVSAPTTLRLARYKSAFRVTHRFTRPVDQGDFTDALGDLFGIDSGAQIGLEFRFAPIRGGQVVFYRTNDKTIQFTGQYSLLQPSDGQFLGIAPVVTVEGTDNFSDIYSPSVGVSVSATFADRLALYAVPIWVGNSNLDESEEVVENDTFMIGAGARLLLMRGWYLVGEAWPRVSGYKGGHSGHVGHEAEGEGKMLASFAIEKQVGGHVFQVNLSNAWATTPANIARGAAFGPTDWYLGFQISRKFY